MSPENIKRISTNLIKGWMNDEVFQPLRGDDRPTSMSEAYDLQAAVYKTQMATKGYNGFGGHKVALTSPAIQEMCGVNEPAYGSIIRDLIYSSGHVAKTNEFVRIGLEFEVCFEMGEDIPPSKNPYTAETITPYVGAAMPAFELIDDRAADYSDLDAISILTDRCWCNGVVLGAKTTEWHALDLANLKGEVIWNKVHDETGNTGAALGNPLTAVAFVANHLASRNRQLKAGEIVMTGSAVKTRFPQSGDVATYRVEGLGEVSISIA